MSITYNYHVTDTANTAVHSATLIREIEDAAFVPVFESLDVSSAAAPDDTLDITFDLALSGPEETALTALVAAHQGLATTRDFQRWESGGEQQTGLATFQTAMSETAAPMREGVYVVIFQCEVRVVAVTTLDSKAKIRYRIDGSAKALNQSPEDDWVALPATDFISLQEGDTPSFEIQWARDGGDDLIDIRKLKIMLFNVA